MNDMRGYDSVMSDFNVVVYDNERVGWGMIIFCVGSLSERYGWLFLVAELKHVLERTM
jgi:hypothetical protein